MTDLRQLATQLALDPTVPPKVRCKALDVLFALNVPAIPETYTPSLADLIGKPITPPPNVADHLNIPHWKFNVSPAAPPEMPPEMMSEFEPGLLGGPPGVWVDAVTPPEVK
jgi:hypothetical protein